MILVHFLCHHWSALIGSFASRCCCLELSIIDYVIRKGSGVQTVEGVAVENT